MPLVDIQYAYGKVFNRLVKRVFDFGLSSLILPVFLPIYLVSLFFNSKISLLPIKVEDKKFNLLKSSSQTINFSLNILNIWLGKMSFVGAPLHDDSNHVLKYKPGLTGILQINKNKLIEANASENFEIYYLKSQSLFLDIEILLTAIFKRT